ncbi:MAG: hypothetical protein M1530_02105 [Candidatus Marsarchaeota archaeon]|nr:hypothetical protein [Candidatus Marsarchaeota archaeon]
MAQPILKQPVNIVVKNSFEAIGQFRMRGLVCATIADTCLKYKDSDQIAVLGEDFFRGCNGQVSCAGPLMIFEEKGQKLGEYISARDIGNREFWFKVPKQYVKEPSSLGFIIQDKVDKTGYSLRFGEFTGAGVIAVWASDSAVIPFRIPKRETDCFLARDDLEKILGQPTDEKFVFQFSAEPYANLLRFYDYAGTYGNKPATHVITAYNLVDNSFGNIKVFGKSP